MFEPNIKEEPMPASIMCQGRGIRELKEIKGLKELKELKEIKELKSMWASPKGIGP